MASPSNPPPATLAEALQENEELRRSLAQSQEQLQQFLYAASHDLQEPLRGILAYAQLLDRQLIANPLAKEYSSFIVAGANRMKELLQHVLVYSRAGSSKRRSVINLNMPLQRALLKMASEIKSADATITRHSLPDVLADEGEIAQVFENLLGNSLKFRSQVAPQIAISAEQGSAECTVSVRDNGAGIEPRFREEVLLPFKRLHGHEIPGSGLGLAISNKIVQAHHGRIWVESDGLNGTVVRFTLPL